MSVLPSVYFVGSELELLVYGINACLFTLCTYVLVVVPGKERRQHSILIASIISQFLFATAHVWLTFAQTYKGVISANNTGVPFAATLYLLNYRAPIVTAANALFTFMAQIQDMMLLWRLYVVWGGNWRITIIPIILQVAHQTNYIASTVMLANKAPLPSGAPQWIVLKFADASFALNAAFNVLTCGLIASKLWCVARLARNFGVARVIVESGAVYVTALVVCCGLSLARNQYTFTALSVLSQVVVLSPLMIALRVGLARHRYEIMPGQPKQGDKFSFVAPLASVKATTSSDVAAAEEAKEDGFRFAYVPEHERAA